MDQMDIDLHQKTSIQNEEATSLSSDSKDDTSPPNKRVKHVSEFDSSKQEGVFDFELPKHEPGLARQWYALFDFQVYIPERPKRFQDMVTKCTEEVAALQKVSDDAKSIFVEVFEEGLKKQMKLHCRYASRVIKTISDVQLELEKDICEARKMLSSVKSDVEYYLENIDKMILEREEALDLYMKNIDQLAKIPNVDKMIKYMNSKGVNYDHIKEGTGLTLHDVCSLTLTLRRTNQSYFDTEEDEIGEEFGQSEVDDVLKEENHLSFGELRRSREAFEKAGVELTEKLLGYEHDLDEHVDRLLNCLQSAAARLWTMREQMNLLHDKKVIVNGYYRRFFHDWNATFAVDGKAIIKRYF